MNESRKISETGNNTPTKKSGDNLNLDLEKSYRDKKAGHRTSKSIERNFSNKKRELDKYFKMPFVGELTEGEKNSLTWFLENYYQIEETAKNIEDSFDPKAAAFLPILDDYDEFRIFYLSKNYLDEKKQPTLLSLINYFKKIQKSAKLTLSELWFLPISFQILIIESLSGNIGAIYKKTPTSNRAQKNQEIKYLIKFLISLKKINWKDFVEPTSAVEEVLAKDPEKIYSKMDFKTRDRYWHIIEEIAERSGLDELYVAKKCLALSMEEKIHIGFFLAGKKRELLEKSLNYKIKSKESIKRMLCQKKGMPLFGILVLFSLILSLFFTKYFSGIIKVPIFIFSMLITIAAVESFVNRVLAKLFPPKILYKMSPGKYFNNLPQTLVVIPTMITKNIEAVQGLLDNLELNYLANKDSNIYFGLALSFSESKEKKDTPTKEEALALEKLKKGLKSLNEKYSDKEEKFWLFFRKRTWSECQGLCLEWERKRGKLISLVRALRDGTLDDFSEIIAPKDILKETKYIITLDQGELLTKGAAKKLIATMIHPLNAPKIDPEKKSVTEGYGIIQPMVSPYYSEDNSLFKKMLGHFGWDSYQSPSSNPYQDIFEETVFIGKGIFDVDVFSQLIDDRFPENTILSHDILEGFYCRTGYASDIQVFEEEPINYLSYSQRRERWIRGDWQNIFWLFNPKFLRQNNDKNPFEPHQKWRILNNLIRSLVFPSAVMLLLITWFVGPSNGVLGLSLFIILIFNTDLWISLFDSFPSLKTLSVWKFYLSYFQKTFFSIFLNLVFRMSFMFHLAVLSLESITKALYRVFILKKKTLEWQAFHLSNRKENSILKSTFIFMISSEILAFLIFIFYVSGTRPVTPLPFLIIILWLLAPFTAFIYSLEFKKDNQGLTEKEKRRLRLIALKTWRFFEENVNEKTNYLPPDHLSEDHAGKTAEMTSITNIGVYLLSCKAANDLGFISMSSFLTSSALTLKSITDLDRHKGHFFNWYGIKNKNSLHPLYISTVDSGNFAVSLKTLKSSIEETKKFLKINQKEAIHDYTILMQRALEKEELNSETKNRILAKIRKIRETNLTFSYKVPYLSSKNINTLMDEVEEVENIYLKKVGKKHLGGGFYYWTERAKKLLKDNYNDIKIFYPWIESKDEKILSFFRASFNNFNLRKIETNTDVKDNRISEELFNRTQINKIQKFLVESKSSLTNHIKLADEQINEIEQIIEEIDFSFLYDQEKKLFRIGYNLDKKRFDKNYYDLYASEARLSSYFAISWDQVPVSHWSVLGRPQANYKGRLALVSWGGSVFEYFFPQLFLPRKKGTFLDIALKTAFWGHVDYANKNSIPWGISESSYGQKNKNKDYLYKIHGVPELSLRRMTKKDLVVAPYATLLALKENPKRGLKNIELLQSYGCEGKYGFYESIDFSKNKKGDIARAYMSHHQGSIILSITNYLKDQIFEHRFMANPEAKSISYILEEKIPKLLKLRRAYDVEKESGSNLLTNIKIKPEAPYLDAPLINILSNGRLRSYCSSRGSGFLEYGNISLTPFDKDPVLDNSGVFLYISDFKEGKLWSSTYLPTLVDPDNYSYFFGKNFVKFERVDGGIASTTEIFLHPKINAEIRALTLYNKTQQRKTLEVSSFGEVALSSHGDYWSHPFFQKLKIRKEIRSESIIVFKRIVPRGVHSPVFAHLFYGPKEVEKTLDPFIEKGNFINSGSLKDPDAFKRFSAQDQKRGFEAIFSIRGKISLFPLEKKTIYFVNLYAGREDRYRRSIDYLGDYHSLNKIHLSIKEDAERQAPEDQNIQKITSLILYHRPQIKATSQQIKEAKRAVNINWQLPSVLIEINQNFTKFFINEALRSLGSILNKGLKFNIIILSHEKDEYSKNIGNYVEQLVEQLGSEDTSNRELRDYVTIISAAGLDDDALKGLPSACNVYWDASKKSLNDLINKDFRNI